MEFEKNIIHNIHAILIRNVDIHTILLRKVDKTSMSLFNIPLTACGRNFKSWAQEHWD